MKNVGVRLGQRGSRLWKLGRPPLRPPSSAPARRRNPDTQKKLPLPSGTQLFFPARGLAGLQRRPLPAAAPRRPRLIPQASEVTQRAPPPPLDPLLLPRRADLQEAAAAAAAEAEKRWRTVWTT